MLPQLTAIGLLRSGCLLSIKDNLLTVAGVGILDGAPLLDIKPDVPAFDASPRSRAG